MYTCLMDESTPRRFVNYLEGRCGWLVEDRNWNPEPDSPVDLVRECGAVWWETDSGWECKAGHSYVSMETRWREGWDYEESY